MCSHIRIFSVLSEDNDPRKMDQQCDFCGKLFFNKQVLAKHRELHTGQLLVKFGLEMCGYVCYNNHV